MPCAWWRGVPHLMWPHCKEYPHLILTELTVLQPCSGLHIQTWRCRRQCWGRRGSALQSCRGQCRALRRSLKRLRLRNTSPRSSSPLVPLIPDLASGLGCSSNLRMRSLQQEQDLLGTYCIIPRSALTLQALCLFRTMMQCMHCGVTRVFQGPPQPAATVGAQFECR